jgi:hypothetical protein
MIWQATTKTTRPGRKIHYYSTVQYSTLPYSTVLTGNSNTASELEHLVLNNRKTRTKLYTTLLTLNLHWIWNRLKGSARDVPRKPGQRTNLNLMTPHILILKHNRLKPRHHGHLKVVFMPVILARKTVTHIFVLVLSVDESPKGARLLYYKFLEAGTCVFLVCRSSLTKLRIYFCWLRRRAKRKKI